VTARGSIANEPGSQRFEVIADEENPDVVYLNEVYADVEAFQAHAAGPHFTVFFEKASRVAEGPVWLMKGTTVPQPA
jgi:(4S)-4-hydroxy-5-phosphonooxypentane-2,3-dione isomerase